MLTSPESAPSRLVLRGRKADHETLPGLLRRWGCERAEQPAITFLDYRAVPSGAASTLTWRELDDRVDLLAAWLHRNSAPGDRAALLIGQGIDYVVAFLAALRAGLVAVPLFTPDLPGHTDRLAAVLADAAPSLVLTTRERLGQVRKFLDGVQPPVRQLVPVDSIPEVAGRTDVAAELRPQDAAYLQYTSGSTRTPTGVIITHGNVVANARQAADVYSLAADSSVSVSWLPLFHDMGLVLTVAAPVLTGMASVLMDPLSFLEKPVRWLRALSANPGAISAAPNFAYGLCASRVAESDKALLQLGDVGSLINGAEPPQAAVIDRFHEAFSLCGLKPETHRSSYGLAEATVLVSVSAAGAPPRQVAFDRAQLANGHAVAGTGPVSTLVAAGRPAGQRVLIVDPLTRRERPAGRVGEIWVSGPNVGRGYWRRPELSAETFCALVGESSEAEPTWWLRTGDLGVFYEDELYVTGRIKDLILVDGRNHYPQDVEATVEQAHPAVRPHAVAAFAVAAGEGERAVVAVERSKWTDVGMLDVAEVVQAIRRTVSAQHGLALHDVVVLPADRVPRTTSGKISRSRCRTAYLDGTFGRTGLR